MLTDSVPKLRVLDPGQRQCDPVRSLREAKHSLCDAPPLAMAPMASGNKAPPSFLSFADSESVASESSKSLILIREREKP